jgi:transcriptional regulator with XRE-family HTH domain
MSADLGSILRQLRVRKDATLEAVSHAAGIAPSTLWRWETGRTCPRLPELDAVLTALGVPHDERVHILHHHPRARARKALVNAAPHEGASLQPIGHQALLPGVGDLWRALRRRAGRSIGQLASQIGVAPSTVSRWERSVNAPSDDRLPDLLDVLEATDNERHVLRSRQTRLDLSTLEMPTDELAHIVWNLRTGAGGDIRLLSDLDYLIAEEALGLRLAGGIPAVRRWLAFCYIEHARYLLWRGRRAESGSYAYRALALLAVPGSDTALSVEAAMLAARFEAYRGRKRHFSEGIRFLERWTKKALPGAGLANIYRDLAEFASNDGRVGQALWAIGTAKRLADAAGLDDLRMPNDIIHSRALLRAGHLEEGLDLVPAGRELPPGYQLLHLFVRARALIEMGLRSDAHHTLSRAHDVLERNGFEHERPHLAGLEQLLDDSNAPSTHHC